MLCDITRPIIGVSPRLGSQLSGESINGSSPPMDAPRAANFQAHKHHVHYARSIFDAFLHLFHRLSRSSLPSPPLSGLVCTFFNHQLSWEITLVPIISLLPTDYVPFTKILLIPCEKLNGTTNYNIWASVVKLSFYVYRFEVSWSRT